MVLLILVLHGLEMNASWATAAPVLVDTGMEYARKVDVCTMPGTSDLEQKHN